ncbi:MAG: DUF616 domain-containing protein [Paludibacteraceae bacterium]|nr:DUF616 domain-containing protein [Paludibacteraceae bacterium]
MQHKKYAIYTAMVGGYDEIMQPVVVDDRFEYILFSNDIKEDRVGVWQVRPIAYTNPDNTRICRYVKTHPEELLLGYDASVWMDSNIRIMTSAVYERIIELYESGSVIASMNHPLRDCIYDEAFEVMYIRYEREKVVVDWCHKLRKENYPKHNGLYETNVMFRKHNTSLISETNVMWWDCIEKYSKRDQLSFNYVLWKLGVKCECFLGKHKCVHNSTDFSYIEHQNIGKKRYMYSNDEWLLKYAYKKPYKKTIVKQRYEWCYAKCFPSLWIAIFGQYYRLKEILRRYMATHKSC